MIDFATFSDHNDTKNLNVTERAVFTSPYHHHAIHSFKSFWNSVQISKLQPAFSKHACVSLVRITGTVTHVAPTPSRSRSPSFRQRNIIMRKYHRHAWDWCRETRKQSCVASMSQVRSMCIWWLLWLFLENKQNNTNMDKGKKMKKHPRGCLDTPSGFELIFTYSTQIVKNNRSHYW